MCLLKNHCEKKKTALSAAIKIVITYKLLVRSGLEWLLNEITRIVITSANNSFNLILDKSISHWGKYHKTVNEVKSFQMVWEVNFSMLAFEDSNRVILFYNLQKAILARSE